MRLHRQRAPTGGLSTPSFSLLRFTPFYTCLPDDFTTPPCDPVIASIGVWRFTLPCCLHHNNLLFNVHMTPPSLERGTGRITLQSQDHYISGLTWPAVLKPPWNEAIMSDGFKMRKGTHDLETEDGLG
ncbi:hypothetical protein CMEL01_10771 [Colletotrichum melonis]|uniref:Uncharacterized protein n=1 Tax=Colletotrichum melonis TaxID=1209925 RepID=A0AAI9V321_9PEZI|nr:hypothetical protein CMEL01_10771 [Colletotrichum melonis]